jgi:soluble lytic murein transglycosylase-like protein
LAVLILLAIIVLVPQVYADDLDSYFNLRRENQAQNLQISTVKSDPASYKGRLLELRGKLSGTSRNGDRTFFIFDTGDGCYVITADNAPNFSSGSKLCMLVRVGDSPTLSDLKYVAAAFQSAVIDRERRAIQAEEAKQAALAAKRKQAQEIARVKKNQTTTNRSQQQYTSADELVAIYRKAIKSYNPRLSQTDADTIARSILGFSVKYQVDPRLVVAVILAESRFNPNATSRKGAMGLGQLMPGTANGLGVSNAYDPVQNIAGSVRLIRGHLDRLTGNAAWADLTWHDLSMALASYNAGSGAVRKYGGVPPYRETRNYIKKVISIYRELSGCK